MEDINHNALDVYLSCKSYSATGALDFEREISFFLSWQCRHVKKRYWNRCVDMTRVISEWQKWWNLCELNTWLFMTMLVHFAMAWQIRATEIVVERWSDGHLPMLFCVDLPQVRGCKSFFKYYIGSSHYILETPYQRCRFDWAIRFRCLRLIHENQHKPGLGNLIGAQLMFMHV